MAVRETANTKRINVIDATTKETAALIHKVEISIEPCDVTRVTIHCTVTKEGVEAFRELIGLETP